MNEVVIIGAGLAGLTCARRLTDAGVKPIILEKSRGVGGRMATRRVAIGEAQMQFDHGAQYATAREAGFKELLDKASSACAIWDSGKSGEHFVGVPAMSSIARAIAAGLDVRQGVEVTALTRIGDGWIIEAGSDRYSATQVVLAVPAPQAAAILGSNHPFAEPLNSVVMEPCLTLMAAFSPTSPKPFISRIDKNQPLSWIAQDSSKPERATTFTTWVAQASAAWSAKYLEEDGPAVAQRMLPLLCTAIGASPDDVRHSAGHRWLYARVTKPLGQPFLRNEDTTLHLGGDWCIGARIEAAWASGNAIANDILELRNVE